MGDELRAHVAVRLGRQLGRFALRIERASVRFSDLDGPRGGSEICCRIKIVLSGLPSLLIEQRAATPGEAFDRCAEGAERAVRRALERAAVKSGRTTGAASVRRSPESARS